MKTIVSFAVLLLVATVVAVAQTALPQNAQKLGEGFGYAAYTVETGLFDDDKMPQVDLWMTGPDGKAARLFRTALNYQPVTWDKAKEYPVSTIKAITTVTFLKNSDTNKLYMVIEGCPDERNILSYLMPLDWSPRTALHIPANSGFAAYNKSDNTFCCVSYAYDETMGRYNIVSCFDFDGNLLRQLTENEADALGGDTNADACDDDNNYQHSYQYIDEQLNSAFVVKGTPNIKSFLLALPMFDNDFFASEDYTLDVRNGYFAFRQEGDGHIEYSAALWNRTDGRKLFVVSWSQSESFPYDSNSNQHFDTKGSYNEWYRYSVVGYDPNKKGNDLQCYGIDTGYRAYLYDAATHQLKPLAAPPVNGLPKSSAHRFMQTPQHGKDILMRETIYQSENDATNEWFTLHWNGLSFDYVK